MALGGFLSLSPLGGVLGVLFLENPYAIFRSSRAPLGR